MAENFNLIFGSQAPETASWSDADYQTGWNTVGSTPPTAEQFDFLQNRADKKAQELYNRLTPLEQKAQEQGRQAGTAYTAGASVTVDGLPADWLLVCTTAGTSGTSAVVLPDPLVDGATITDGNITWTLRKLATNGALGYRQPSTSYALGAVAHNAGLPTGTYLECTTAGISGSGTLTISTPTVGGTVSDGTVTWTIRKNASTQDLTGYLPLSGGAMTGADITRNVDNSTLSIRGGSDYDKGGSLELYGKDYDIDSLIGAFRLIARNAVSGIYLTGMPDGTLTWNGNSLDKSAVVAESLGVNGYRKYASGMIEQWGTLCKFDSGDAINTWLSKPLPISFTEGSYNIVVSNANNLSGELRITPGTFNSYSISRSSADITYYSYRAIGY